MKNSKSGFTLVELLVASAISLVGVSAMLTVFLSVSKAFYSMSDSAAMNQQATILQLRILYDFRSITQITAASEQSLSAKYIDFGTGTSHDILYEIRNGGIYRSTDGGAANLICSNVVTSGNSYSKFWYQNQSGTVSSTMDIGDIRGAKIYIVPVLNTRQTLGLTRPVNLPFYSSLVQFRNISFK